MADIRKGFKNSETVQNMSKIRTPMTPDNKYKRIGLLLIGVALIIAGIIVWITAANSAATTEEAQTTVVETTAEE